MPPTFAARTPLVVCALPHIRFVRRSVRLATIAFVAALVALWPAAPVASAPEGRYFDATGYRVVNPAFLNYFDRRGGLKTFGYPVSRDFTLNGFRVQFFQRLIMQQRGDGSMTTLNLLDSDLMPYTQINSAKFPALDTGVVGQSPAPGSPSYATRVLDYVRSTAPDSWKSLQVNFSRAFQNTVTAADAFPGQRADAGILAGLNLEMWGVPTSQPAFDPRNEHFVYQRYQRGIMHFDRATGTTQGLLLADYLKAIITGEGIPPDLEGQSKTSRFYRQYDPTKPQWLARPTVLGGTDMTLAFEREPIIAIDPGHGGIEVGASAAFADGTVLREKDLNLKVALRTAAILRANGFQVVTTRTTDARVNPTRDVTGDGKANLTDDIQARIDLANSARATLLLSIHLNGYEDRTQRGTEVYYDNSRPFALRSRRLAELAQTNLLRELAATGAQTRDRSVKITERAAGAGNSFYLLGPKSVRPSQMPGALGEALFLTNTSDADRLRDPATLEAIAQAYAKAVMAYYSRG
jgi:N-acetylmuramoyl-L-alanine amidase